MTALTLYHSTYHGKGIDLSEFKRGKDFGLHLGSLMTATARLSIKREEDEITGVAKYTNYDSPAILVCEVEVGNVIELPEEKRGGGWTASSIIYRLMEKLAEQIENNEPLAIQIDPDIVWQFLDEETLYMPEDAKNDFAQEDFNEQIEPTLENDFLLAWLKHYGVDSISYENAYEGGGVSYLITRPDQIKVVECIQLEAEANAAQPTISDTDSNKPTSRPTSRPKL